MLLLLLVFFLVDSDDGDGDDDDDGDDDCLDHAENIGGHCNDGFGVGVVGKCEAPGE